MIEIKMKFSEKIQRTENIFSFRFIPETKPEFIPGQFLQLLFDHNNLMNNSLNKFLSISCAPVHNYIEVTKRISNSDFSKSLTSLNVGDEIYAKIPMGNCTIKENEKIAFITGGIGITPVISMLEDLYIKKSNKNIILLYSNRNKDDIAFKQEIDLWTSELENMKTIYTVDRGEPVKDGFTGYINADIIQKVIPDFKSRIIYLFGPPIMVTKLTETLNSMDFNIKQIISEKFMGY